MNLVTIEQKAPGSPPRTLNYETTGDVLTVTHRTYTWGEPDEEGNRQPVLDVETVDTFDFSGVPDGKLDVDTITTSLPVQPIVSGERVSGTLTVTVLEWV